ncbi:hypothetical protein D3C86_2263590 [compost metagenome]
MRIDIGQRELAADEFRHLEQVRDQRLGEADRPGADDCDFERHSDPPTSTFCRHACGLLALC